MTTVIGKISDSFDGVIVVTPDYPFVDNTEEPPALVITPFEENINNGVFAIAVPQSEKVVKSQNSPEGFTEAVTYTWQVLQTIKSEIYYLQTGEVYEGAVCEHEGNYYTGGSYSPTDSRRLDLITEENQKQILKIHAVCPDDTNLPAGEEAVEFTSLVAIPAQGAWLGIGVRRIANLLTDPNQPYLAQVSSGFNFRGEYDPSAAYEIRDSVSFEGSSYVWIDANGGSNQPPSDSWQLIASRGETGSGTSAQITGYNADTWRNSSESTAQADVVDALSSIENLDPELYALKAETPTRDGATFVGSMKRLSYPPEIDQEITTVAYVREAISNAVPNSLPPPLVLLRRTSGVALSPGVAQKITWNSTEVDDFNYWDIGTGELTLPQGLYLFYVSLRTNMISSNSNTTHRLIRQIDLYQVAPTSRVLAHFSLTNQTADYTSNRDELPQGMAILSLEGGERLNFRIMVSQLGEGSILRSEILAQSANNYLAVWRLG